MAKDPICGMFVEEGKHALQTTRYGTTYYFCSQTCLAQFQAPEKTLARLKRLVALGAAFTIPSAALSYLPISPDHNINNLVMFALSLPVQFVVGYRFYLGSYDALRSRVGNMDLLISLGTTAAWVYSTIATFVPGFFPGSGTYFETSAIIITLIQTGNLLEYITKVERRRLFTGYSAFSRQWRMSYETAARLAPPLRRLRLAIFYWFVQERRSRSMERSSRDTPQSTNP